MKISDWLSNHYRSRLDPTHSKSFEVLQHEHGPTWNDGGGWNLTIVRCGNEVFKVEMPTDYRADDLTITKMKIVMKEAYEPA